MTEHLHSEFVETCYRCQLNQDELSWADRVTGAVLYWDEWDGDDEEYDKRWKAIEDLLAARDARVWEQGRASVAEDFLKPMGDTGMRPVSPNPYKETK